MKHKITSIFIVIVLLLVVALIAAVYALDNTEVKMKKQFGKVVVEKNELVDYHVFLSPVGKFSPLLQIDSSTRKEIADYMRDNDLKLEEGEHQFKRTTSTLQKYITEDFRFEKIGEEK